MIQTNRQPLLVLLGPTASGKTALAVALAQKLSAEIINADSRQVYSGMDIGTGKDLSEYGLTPYHLIDILPAGEKYNLSLFQSDFQRIYSQLSEQGKNAIVCGGSGLYLQAVLQNYQQTRIPKHPLLRKQLEEHSTEELKNLFLTLPNWESYPGTPTSKNQLIRAIEVLKQDSIAPRLHTSYKFSYRIFGLNPETSDRRQKISDRLRTRLEQGLVTEVESLLAQGISAATLEYYGLEYKWTTRYVLGELSFEEYFQKLETSIHRFAKRQMTYFRKMEKDGLKIEWIDPSFNLLERRDWVLEKLNHATYL